MHEFFVWVMEVLQDWGYGGVVVLMAMESSIFPVPSELVVPPAAYWASQGEMTYAGVILSATFGSWLGSALTYWVSAWVGRPILLRYGKYILIPPEKLRLAERWVARYGTGGIFFARLLPVIRHLISIPAGICRMDFGRFSVMTTLGAALWCSVLTWFGPRVITPEMFNNAEDMVHALKAQMHWIVLLFALLAGLYAIMTWVAHRDAKLSGSAQP